MLLRLTRHMVAVLLSAFGPNHPMPSGQAEMREIMASRVSGGGPFPPGPPPGLAVRNSAAKKAKHRARGWSR